VLLLIISVIVAVVGSMLVPPLARWASVTMKPSTAVTVSSAASLTAAVGLGISLSAVAIASLAGWGPVAREGHVSAGVLHSLVSVPTWVGTLAAVLVATLAVRAATRATAMGVAFYRSARLCHQLAGRGDVVFTDDTDIVTLAGLRGRILVGRQLFERLEPADRRVALAHEHSHLRRRHHLYVQAVELAAAANPLLAGVPDTVRWGIERWADEDAAAAEAVAGRHLAARALARVALQRQRLHAAAPAGEPCAASAGALAVAALQVSSRVQALLAPAPRLRATRALLITAIATATLAAGVLAIAHVNSLIEIAQAGPPSLPRP
jgi:hypothetical protein